MTHLVILYIFYFNNKGQLKEVEANTMFIIEEMTDRLMPSDNEGSQTSIDSAVHYPNVLDSSAYPS